MADRVTITADAKVDTASAELNPAIVDDGKGGVKVDPSKVAPPAEETPKAEGERPEWLPEKFKTAEDLAKAYAELEKMRGKPPAEKPAETPAEAPSTEEAKAEAEKVGVDFDALVTEFTEKGELAEETLKSLEAKGINRQTVQNYIRGQQAIAESLTLSLAEQVGGKEQLQQVLAWAKTNMSETEVTAYNAAIDLAQSTGNTDVASLALQGLQSRFTAANGKDPKLLSGDNAPPGGIQPFDSSAQVVEAMKDKRYQTDPAYRDKVAKRLAASNIW